VPSPSPKAGSPAAALRSPAPTPAPSPRGRAPLGQKKKKQKSSGKEQSRCVTHSSAQKGVGWQGFLRSAAELLDPYKTLRKETPGLSQPGRPTTEVLAASSHSRFPRAPQSRVFSPGLSLSLCFPKWADLAKG